MRKLLVTPAIGAFAIGAVMATAPTASAASQDATIQRCTHAGAVANTALYKKKKATKANKVASIKKGTVRCIEPFSKTEKGAKYKACGKSSNKWIKIMNNGTGRWAPKTCWKVR
ncbi:hypothetical protein [Actinomadura rudentiformis]|uniref:SH3 domain-containing protein n=1 Tax=Actinomadura rudentiformis TaxID=359158 RepID=A0A6H9YDT5_9ACTN|nr:hypothetical protein [Actinomadura rudentiformis]KAB2342418.1 hypothetical protein F8566_38355 [Actinomadura rudentiformis]